MTRGTTPSLTFNLPFDTSLLIKAYITLKYYKDNKIQTLEKTLSDCELYGSVLSATLTQEETLSLPSGKSVDIQLRVVMDNGTAEGSALASEIFTVPVERILKEGVI